MTNESIKAGLLSIEKPQEDFSVVLSGKESKKVDGLYKYQSREILLHNKNFNSESELMYTAIHEFAHHIQFTENPIPVYSRSHTTRFWNIFHGLLIKAEKAGAYTSVFSTHPDFIALTREIKEKIITQNGQLMKEFGKVLLKAKALCDQHHMNFEDYMERILNIPRTSAAPIIKSHSFNLDPNLGFENMRLLSRISDSDAREQAQKAMQNGESSDMVKTRFLQKPEPAEKLAVLNQEKNRLEKTIHTLEGRLAEINNCIKVYQQRSASEPETDPGKILNFKAN